MLRRRVLGSELELAEGRANTTGHERNNNKARSRRKKREKWSEKRLTLRQGQIEVS